jgi:hypothetical protein
MTSRKRQFFGNMTIGTNNKERQSLEGNPSVLCGAYGCERNARTFNGEEKSVPALKFSFLQSLFEWLKVTNLVTFCSD